MTAEIVGLHPYADKFPMLTDSELDELAESIATVGLIHPVIVNPAGLVLDGRNRLEACNRAQVEARIEVYAGTDIAEYVIACNVTRRNLSTGQRAMSTALVLEADGRRENGRWRRGTINQSSDLSDGFRVSLHQAGIILDFLPNLAAVVASGATSLNDAFTQADAIRTSADRDKILRREKAKREKAEAAAEAEQNATIIADLNEAGATVYLDMIEANQITPMSAWAAFREDTRKERERDAQEREVLRDRYTSMAQACLTASSWGEYDDFQALMTDYEAGLLNPPQLDQYLTVESLEAVRRFADELIEWRKSL